MSGGWKRVGRWRAGLLALVVALLGSVPGVTLAAGTYLVQPGDTLGELAEEFGIPLSVLATTNGLADPDRLLAGMILAIPDSAAGGPETYVVQEGDTLWDIAVELGMTTGELVALNPAIADPERILPGQALALPAGGSVVSAAAAPALGDRGTGLLADLDADLRALIAAYAPLGLDSAGVLVKVGCTGAAVRIDPDLPFPAASLYKVFVLWAIQIEIRAGVLSDATRLTLTAATDASEEDGYSLGPDGSTISVGEARRLMIAGSSNSAALLLVRALGGWGALGALVADSGFPAPQFLPAPAMTPRAITRFFEGLVTRTLDPRLAEADYALMLSLLGEPGINAFLEPGLPTGTRFVHKGGNLVGVQHDAGVALLPDGCPLYVTALTTGDYQASVAFLRDVAWLVGPLLTGEVAR